MRQAPPRILLQAPAKEQADVMRCVGWQRAPVDVILEHRRERDRDVVAFKCPPAGEHLEHDDAEGPDVGASIDRSSPRLLGRHVGRRAEDEAGLRRVHRERRRHRGVRTRSGRRIQRFREPEIEHLDGAVVAYLDVRRFEIAMDDALVVRDFERFGNLASDRQRFVDAESGRTRGDRPASGRRRAP